MEVCEQNSSVSQYDPTAGSCEKSKESLGPIKKRENLLSRCATIGPSIRALLPRAELPDYID
jgi:hypothetical protein